MDKLSDFVTRWFYSENEPNVPDVFRQANRFKEKTMIHTNVCTKGAPHSEWQSLQTALDQMPVKASGEATRYAFQTRLHKFVGDYPDYLGVDNAMLYRYLQRYPSGILVSNA